VYLGIPNARTIQETQKEQERQPRQETPVHLSDELGLVDARHVYVRIVNGSRILLAAISWQSISLFDALWLFAVRGDHFAERGRGEKGKSSKGPSPSSNLTFNGESCPATSHNLEGLISRVAGNGWARIRVSEPMITGWSGSQDKKQIELEGGDRRTRKRK
jgi:hypothetical protein